MTAVIKAERFIPGWRLNYQQFQMFLNDFDTKHQDLAYFFKVRWVGKISIAYAVTIFKLQKVAQFLKNKRQLTAEMKDKSWLHV